MEITHGNAPSGDEEVAKEESESLRQAIIPTSPRLCVAIKKTVTKSRK